MVTRADGKFYSMERIIEIVKEWGIYFWTSRPVDKDFLRERVALTYPLDDLLKRRDKALELIKIDFNKLMKANGKVKYIDYEDDNVKIYYKKELTFENFVDMNPFSNASKIIKAIVEKKKKRSLMLLTCEDKIRELFIKNFKLVIFKKLSSDRIEHSYDSEWRPLRELTHYKKLIEQEENEQFNIFWDGLRKNIIDELEIFTLRFLPFFFGNSVVNKNILDLISMYLDSTGKLVIRKRFSAHIDKLFVDYDNRDEGLRRKRIAAQVLHEAQMKKWKEEEEARVIKLRNEEEARALKAYKAAELQPALLTLASDKQNVHTGAINVKANEAMDSILKTVVPFGFSAFLLPEVLNLIWFRWNNTEQIVSKPRFLDYEWPLRTDMKRHAMEIFYLRTGEEGDELVQELRYKRLLCCVVAKIEQSHSEMRNELYIRLWEECLDSLGMCFQGHMSRLCNVFSGFDPGLPLVASRGEQIQAAFQDLSTKNILFSQKKEEAFKIFEKFSIEDEETRKGWLSVLVPEEDESDESENKFWVVPP